MSRRIGVPRSTPPVCFLPSLPDIAAPVPCSAHQQPPDGVGQVIIHNPNGQRGVKWKAQRADVNRLELEDMKARVNAQGSGELEFNYRRIDNALDDEGA